MDELILKIPQLDRVLKNQEKILKRLDELESKQLPEWVSLKEACTWKGIDPKTIQQPGHRHLMPPLKDRELVGGRLKWPRETILEWVRKNDEKLGSETEHRGLKAV